jgi:class 3 adenylate cyclase
VTRQKVATLMETYLGRWTGARVLAGAIQRGHSETIHAVLWYSDLRDFTALSESLPRDRMIALLNAHFERLAAPIKAFGGEVLKFMGDGLLAIFPTGTGGADRACERALKAARGARAGMAALNGERRGRSESPLAFGLALHLGDVMYGNIGAPDRLDFTVIGPAVNLASRLEALCKQLDMSVLISAAFASACREELALIGSYRLSGIARPAEVFTLVELRGPHGV